MKTIITVIIFIHLLLLTANAQVQLEWMRSYAGQQVSYNMELDTTGNLIVFSNKNGGMSLRKYSPAGNLIWTIEGYNGYIPVDLALDRNNNSFVVGTINTYQYIHLSKRNTNGISQWQKFINPSDAYNRVSDLYVDSLGYSYITGSAMKAGKYLLYLYKLTPVGDTLWSSWYSNGIADEGNKIVVDNQRNVIVTGSSITNNTLQDIVTVKCDSNGVQKWVKRYDRSGTIDIKTDNYGYIYVGGVVDISSNVSNMVVLKYKPDGDTAWVRLFTQDSISSYPHSLLIDSYRNIIISGEKYLPGVYSRRHAVVKYDSSGTLLWDRYGYYYSNVDNSLNSSCLDANNNLYFTGYVGVGYYSRITTLKYSSTGNLIWYIEAPPYYINNIDFVGTKVLTGKDNIVYVCGGGHDTTMLFKYSQVTGIKTEAENIAGDFKLYPAYPNPFNPTTTIKFSIPQVSSPHAPGGDLFLLKVYDMIGREVQTLVNESLKPGTYKVIFDGQGLPSGIYYLCMNVNSNIIKTQKLILIK